MITGDLIPDYDHELTDLLESLLKYASIPEERKEYLYESIHFMSLEDSIKLLDELSNKQIERISGGLNYNMTYLNRFLKRTI